MTASRPIRRIAPDSRHPLAFAVLTGALALGCIQSRPLSAGGAGSIAPRNDAGAGGVDAGAGHPPKQPPCASDLPARVALATTVGPDVVFVMSDGSTRSVHRFDPYPPATGISFGAGVAVRGDYVVATATWWGPGDEQCQLEMGLLNCPETDRIVLLDREGRVRWEKQRSGRRSSASIGVDARVGDQGWIVIYGVFGNVLVAPDGAETDVPPEARGGRPFPGPALPALVPGADPGKSLSAWWRPGRPLAATEPPIEVLWYGVDGYDAGDELDFIGRPSDGALAIVHSRPDLTVVLPDRLDLDVTAPYTTSGSWRAIGYDVNVVTVDLVTGQSRRFSQTLPAGVRSLSRASAGHDGSVAELLRDDSSAAVFVSNDGSTWSPIGRTLGQVETGTIQDFAGTYLVNAQGINSFFVPTQTWPTATDGQTPELLGDSIQLVRPSTGLAAVISPAWYPVVVTSDGLCAAYWETTSSSGVRRFVIHDLARDTRTPVQETRDAWAPTFAFFE